MKDFIDTVENLIQSTNLSESISDTIHQNLNAVAQNIMGISIPGVPQFYSGASITVGVVNDQIESFPSAVGNLDISGFGFIFSEAFLSNLANNQGITQLAATFVTLPSIIYSWNPSSAE